MGKRGFRKRGNSGKDNGKTRGGGGKGGYGPRSGARSTITQADKHNEKFERYYNELGIVEGDEKQLFWDSLRSDLPNSFRFAGSRGHALVVQKRLVEHYIPQIISVTYEGERVAPPTPVQWYPHQLAWSMTTPKNVIRKFPPFASFQKFLVSENNVGNISRQEVVSMIPPYMLDIKPGMTVLDLCAAPGSKTAQLIEMLHGGEEARVRKIIEKIASEKGNVISPSRVEIDTEKLGAFTEGDWADDGRSTGLLIANDIEYRRAQMLVHQVKRLNSPNIIITNHDATLFPSIKVPSESGAKYLKFDRILADVPCSGDGTCRKNPEAWTKWTPGNALGLYITQVRILVRALQMLKVGGRAVYSTCSMNPVEDEAVVASAIERCGGTSKVKILNTNSLLPGLKRKPGLEEWKVMDKTGRIWNSWDEVSRAKESQTEEHFGKLVEGMFRPKEDISLNQCVRIYPHQQDTGGFFIAVLEKQTEIKARPESESKKSAETTSIISVINEIEQKPTNGIDDFEKIKSLDTVLTPTNDGSNNTDATGSAAMRQNRENTPVEAVLVRKHAIYDEADAVASNKKPKFRDETDERSPDGLDSRQVHWPPPPGAELDLTAHGTSNSFSNAPFRNPRNNQPHEEPFKYLDPQHDELLDIYSFYKLSPRFPRDRFMVRNATGQPVKAIYYTSTLAREVLKENEGKGMKFVHCGVKMFMKQDVQNQPNTCKWRIQSEGLPIVEPWVGQERVVRLWKKPTLRKLLIEMFPKVSQGAWQELGEIGPTVRDISMGCCVLRVEPSDDENGFTERLVMPLWRGLSSLNLMLPKEERKAMLLRLYDDDTPLVDHSQERNQKQDENGDMVNPMQSSKKDANDVDKYDENYEKDGGVLNGTSSEKEAPRDGS